MHPNLHNSASIIELQPRDANSSLGPTMDAAPNHKIICGQNKKDEIYTYIGSNPTLFNFENTCSNHDVKIEITIQKFHRLNIY
jgi:hypothetical protein